MKCNENCKITARLSDILCHCGLAELFNYVLLNFNLLICKLRHISKPTLNINIHLESVWNDGDTKDEQFMIFSK